MFSVYLYNIETGWKYIEVVCNEKFYNCKKMNVMFIIYD